MDTQQQEPGYDQNSNHDLSGELHLPHITSAGTQRVAPSAQSEPVVHKSAESSQNVFYFQDDLSDSLQVGEDDADILGSPLATPFQMSGAVPPLYAGSGQFAPTPTSPPATRSARRFPLLRVLILVAVIVIVLLTGALAFAQTTVPAIPVRTTIAQRSPFPQPQPTTQIKKNMPIVRPTTPPAGGGGGSSGTTTGQNTAGAVLWIPQPLPAGWIQAGLTTGDALFGERTAVAFTDREMSLDYRSVGTRLHHGGTFTASTFVLTAPARARFAQNDVRVINNVLFDEVQREQLIQSVVNAQPRLVKFAVVGQQPVAWVDVSFQLWQSKVNASGTRSDGFDRDPVTNQPRTHHMAVLLLRVPRNEQGNNPAMGGTGWLVSNYGLDLPNGTQPDLVQPL